MSDQRERRLIDNARRQTNPPEHQPDTTALGETADLGGSPHAESLGVKRDSTSNAQSGGLRPVTNADHSCRFEVLSPLGVGAFGAVSLAFDRQLNRKVALKTTRRHLASSRQRAAMIHEARHVARLDHPHIVPVYDVLQSGSECIIVYKLIEGESLAARLERGKLPAAEAAQIAVQIADALEYAHRQGLYHRDVKPANILLDQAGRAHLADFGLAIEEHELPGERDKVSGTLLYMAPEQVRGDADCVDGRTDVYALGAVLYQMCCGSRPFAGEKPAEIASQILRREPRPPRQIDTEIPRELETVCMRAMKKQTTERFQTAGEMSAALRHWLDEPKRRQHQKRILKLCLTLAVAAVLVGAAATIVQRPDPIASATGASGDQAAASDGWLVDAGLRLRVLVDKHGGEELAPYDLVNAAPLRADRDYVRIECEAPSAMQLGLFWRDSQGTWHTLDAAPAQAIPPPSQSRSPSTRDARLFRWPEPGADANLTTWELVGGETGVEVLVACATLEGAPRPEDLLAALPANWQWPLVEVSEVIVFNRREVKRFRVRGPSSMRRHSTGSAEAFADMQARIAQRFALFVGVIFTNQAAPQTPLKDRDAPASTANDR